MKQPIKHNFRANLFTKEKKYVLTENSLVINSDNKNESILLNTISKINLQHVPAFKSTPEQFLCNIKTMQNKKIHIGHQSIVSMANFKDNSKTYVPFIKELRITSKIE